VSGESDAQVQVEVPVFRQKLCLALRGSHRMAPSTPQCVPFTAEADMESKGAQCDEQAAQGLFRG